MLGRRRALIGQEALQELRGIDCSIERLSGEKGYNDPAVRSLVVNFNSYSTQVLEQVRANPEYGQLAKEAEELHRKSRMYMEKVSKTEEGQPTSAPASQQRS